MIEQIGDRPEGILEFRIRGHVRGADYDDVLVPAIESAIAKYGRVRALCWFAEDFEGYDLEAAWDDAKLGIRHWTGFERLAVVCDVEWIRQSVRALGFLAPYPVQLFSGDEVEAARRWLQESIGSIHLEKDEAARVLTVKLLGKLEPAAYEGVEEEIDSFMSKGRPRLLLDLREFDGWQGLGALHEHLELVRAHRRVPERVALVGDEAWQELAAKIVSRFVQAKVRYFPEEDADAAAAWVREG